MSYPSIEQQLSRVAWAARENAFARKTKVGCALLASGKVFHGCNIEHDWCQSLHAEVVALAKALSNRHTDVEFILVVSDKEQFIPCGACLDWIVQYTKERDPNTVLIGYQNHPTADVRWFTLKELVPHSPH